MKKSWHLIVSLAIAVTLVWAASILTADEAAAPPAGATPAEASAETQPAPETRPAETQPSVVTVTIFATGDIHEKADYLTRIAGYVKKAKAEDPSVLFFDAGDAISGYGDKELTVTRGEAMYRLMIAAGYDACVFGNHCHGLGKTRIIELLRKYPDFPLLAANIDWTEDEKEIAKLLPPYKIFQLKGVKVAVIGASSHDLRYTKRNRFAVYYELQAVHRLVPVLRKQADIVVAITHQYEKHDYPTASGPNAPDVIVGGHSHGATATPYGRQKKSYLIKAGRYGRYLAVVRLKWDGQKIVERTGEVTRVDKDWPEDEEVKAIRDSYIEAYRKEQEKKEAGKKAAG